jgi:hypothetical protein
LTDSQDKVLKRVQDLKKQIEEEKLVRAQMQVKYESELTEKENLIKSLKDDKQVNFYFAISNSFIIFK